MKMRRLEGPPANPTSLGEVWIGITKSRAWEGMRMFPIGDVLANPTSLGEVWIGITRPSGDLSR
jgi:hypothetical protein